MNTSRKSTLAILGCAALIGGLTPSASAAQAYSATGHGTTYSGSGEMRSFSFNAKKDTDGDVTGQAQLTNRAFTGENGTSPYRLHIEITCMRVDGNIATMGGYTKSTNDPNLVDAVFFSVQDMGEPGTMDRISGAYFWDDIPGTQGDPSTCELVEGGFPTEAIESGNIQVRPTAP